MKNKTVHNIGWCDGEWGPTSHIRIPICDRGLNFGDGIFETILIYQGEPQLLNSHLNRMQNSASILKMASPPSEVWLRSLIREGLNRASLENSNCVLRLNWTRGNNITRGIGVWTEQRESSQHRFWLEINQADPYFHSISTLISSCERRNATSRLSQCKTFAYNQSIQAKHEANIAGYDDALLLSTNGELCCGTTANLIIKRQGQWITPPLDSGCLAGVMRQQGLNSGIIKEANIHHQPYPGDEWLLINSLSCRPIKKLNNQYLNIYSDPKQLWLSLLDIKL